MTVPPGAAEMTQQTSVRWKRFLFLSKIPLVSFVKIYDSPIIFVYCRFFRKLKNSKKPQARRLTISEIYRFADKLDIFLMIIGSIAG